MQRHIKYLNSGAAMAISEVDHESYDPLRYRRLNQIDGKIAEAADKWVWNCLWLCEWSDKLK